MKDKRHKLLRVLMTTDTVGGVWTYSMILARAMLGQNVKFYLATKGGPLSKDQREEALSLSNVHLFSSEYKLEWMRDPWQDIQRATAWLLGLERRLQPDIVHLNDYSHGAAAWNTPVMTVGHTCVYSWWDAVNGTVPPDEWRGYHDLVRNSLDASHIVIAPTISMLESLRHHYGPFEESAVIYNACEWRIYEAPHKEPIIFSAGRLWDEAKNAQLLHDVSSELSWPVYFAGDSSAPGEEAPAANGTMRLLGRIPRHRVRDWMHRAAIYAHPAKHEPFGLSILEAAMSGCALVLGDIPSLREVWGNAAVDINPREPRELRDAIARLISNQSEREHFAQAAQERARRYQPSIMARLYRELYERLVREAQSRKQVLVSGREAI